MSNQRQAVRRTPSRDSGAVVMIVGSTPASSGMAAHAALPAGHQLAGHSRRPTKRT